MSSKDAREPPADDAGAPPGRAVNHDPANAASPVCLGGEADAAYMGYLSREELIAFLNTLLEAERAGAQVTLKSTPHTADTGMKSLLNSVHHDEARWCAMLLRAIRGLGGEPSSQTGAFYGKAMAIGDMRERLAFLNRGQEWVVRKLKEAIPKIRDDGLHRELSDMLTSHERNIALTASFLDKS